VIAWILTIWSNFVCQSVKFEPENSDGIVPTLRFGIWNYKGAAVYEDYDGNLYAASKCNAFPDSAEFDAKWKTAMAFSIVAFIMGFLGLFIPCVAPPKMLKAAGGYFMLLTLFQGLTMMQIASDFCNNNPIVALLGLSQGGYQSSCKMDSGFKLNITATVFYFCAGIAYCMLPADDEEDATPVMMEEKTPAADNKPVVEETDEEDRPPKSADAEA